MSPTHHTRHWESHPAVRTGSDLSFGERAADWMRSSMGSWGFIFGFLGFMGAWMTWNAVAVFGLGFDPFPFILLNLMLSTLAGLQGGILLIAAKRADAVSAALAQHDRETVAELVSINEAQTEILETMRAHLGIGG
ncbi:DUF1003 domain-containing protein [Sinomonas sp. JGH33]|uniref:DUF1003 domain-containing protein n=1 Tax=Sinomonas terricola TaxID=3110330 RepID=A0ABU5T1E6_9MICC|nr:DUF1003 domain-containing protein [Sinomonas sp. JGH33]MEA5453314.1 DUF1003 domain-containing protein [Sinomonas sp. JGH33]